MITPIIVEVMQISKIVDSSIPFPLKSASIAAVAAETGLAVIACCDAMTDMLSGRSGLIPVFKIIYKLREVLNR